MKDVSAFNLNEEINSYPATPSKRVGRGGLF